MVISIAVTVRFVRHWQGVSPLRDVCVAIFCLAISIMLCWQVLKYPLNFDHVYKAPITWTITCILGFLLAITVFVQAVIGAIFIRKERDLIEFASAIDKKRVEVDKTTQTMIAKSNKQKSQKSTTTGSTKEKTLEIGGFINNSRTPVPPPLSNKNPAPPVASTLPTAEKLMEKKLITEKDIEASVGPKSKRSSKSTRSKSMRNTTKSKSKTIKSVEPRSKEKTKSTRTKSKTDEKSLQITKEQLINNNNNIIKEPSTIDESSQQKMKPKRQSISKSQKESLLQNVFQKSNPTIQPMNKETKKRKGGSTSSISEADANRLDQKNGKSKSGFQIGKPVKEELEVYENVKLEPKSAMNVMVVEQ